MNRKLNLAIATLALALVPAACAGWDDGSAADAGNPTSMIRPTPNSDPNQTSLPRTQTDMPGPSSDVEPFHNEVEIQ